VRLFFAAFPDSQSRRHIEAATLALDLPADARLVPAANYHLTLAFAGDVSNAQAAALRLAGAAVRSHAFEVRFDVYEYWPKSAVVVAAASEPPAALIELRRLLCVELDRLGVATDAQAFRPHVTLARKVAQAPVLKAMSGVSWRVNTFQLVHSSRSAEGSVYTVVDSWPLLDKGARAS
jgi:RNA 2',3'-cyclic 3'-phosphodiesterase